MADCDAAFRVVSLTHNSARPLPIGYGINEEVSFLENRPGVRVSPCSVLDSYGCKVSFKYQGKVTPEVRGTTGSCVIVLLTMAAANVTITVTKMLAGAYQSGSGKPFEDEQDFVYNAGATEDLAPISIA